MTDYLTAHSSLVPMLSGASYTVTLGSVSQKLDGWKLLFKVESSIINEPKCRGFLFVTKLTK